MACGDWRKNSECLRRSHSNLSHWLRNNFAYLGLTQRLKGGLPLLRCGAVRRLRLLMAARRREFISELWKEPAVISLPERSCQVFDSWRSYSPYKSPPCCHLKCTCFSGKAAVLYHRRPNKANGAITIWRWNSLTAPCHGMLREGVCNYGLAAPRA